MKIDKNTRLLRPIHSEWNDWVKRVPHDFYFLSEYHQFSERHGDGEGFMIVYGQPDKFVAWPYMVRTVDSTYNDAHSVYGYTGPIGNALNDTSFLLQAWDVFRVAWAEQKIISMFTKFHPLLSNYSHCRCLHGERPPAGGELLTLGRTVAIDLSCADDERFRQYKKKLRQEISSAEKKGLVVNMDSNWKSLDDFIELYKSTMDSNSASERYVFSREYFHDLKKSLSDRLFLAKACVNSELAAGLIFSVNGNFAQAHLTGVNADHLELSPLKGLIEHVAGIAKSLGATVLHLGAGRGGFEDKLFQFKRRFSDNYHEYCIGRYILDSQAYESQTSRVMKKEDIFFPAYRAR